MVQKEHDRLYWSVPFTSRRCSESIQAVHLANHASFGFICVVFLRFQLYLNYRWMHSWPPQENFFKIADQHRVKNEA